MVFVGSKKKKKISFSFPLNLIFFFFFIIFFTIFFLGDKENEENSNIFWKSFIKEKVQEKFKKILSPAEREESFNLKSLLEMEHFISLIDRVTQMIGIKFTSDCIETYRNYHKFKTFLFLTSDVVSVDTRVKHINLIDYAGGFFYIYFYLLYFYFLLFILLFFLIFFYFF